MLTDAQKHFVELEKQKTALKEFWKRYDEALTAVVQEVGLNGYFQDGEGIVYKLVKPEGRFVKFEELSYVRTRRAGEKRGDLSMKEAREAGFVVEGE